MYDEKFTADEFVNPKPLRIYWAITNKKYGTKEMQPVLILESKIKSIKLMFLNADIDINNPSKVYHIKKRNFEITGFLKNNLELTDFLTCKCDVIRKKAIELLGISNETNT